MPTIKETIDAAKQQIDDNNKYKNNLDRYLGKVATPGNFEGAEQIKAAVVDVPEVDEDLLEIVVLGSLFDKDITDHIISEHGGISPQEYYMMNVLSKEQTRGTTYQLVIPEARIKAKKALEAMQNNNDSSMVERYVKNVMDYMHKEGLTHAVTNSEENQPLTKLYKMVDKVQKMDKFSQFKLSEDDNMKLNEKIVLSDMLDETNNYLYQMVNNNPTKGTVRNEMIEELLARYAILSMMPDENNAFVDNALQKNNDFLNNKEFKDQIRNKYKEAHPKIDFKDKDINRYISGENNILISISTAVETWKNKLILATPDYQSHMLSKDKENYIKKVKELVKNTDQYKTLVDAEDITEVYNSITKMFREEAKLTINGKQFSTDYVAEESKAKEIAESYDEKRIQAINEGNNQILDQNVIEFEKAMARTLEGKSRETEATNDEKKPVTKEDNELVFISYPGKHYTENYYVYGLNNEIADKKMQVIDAKNLPNHLKAAEKLGVIREVANLDKSRDRDVSGLKEELENMQNALNTYAVGNLDSKIHIRSAYKACNKYMDNIHEKNPFDPVVKNTKDFLQKDFQNIRGMSEALKDDPELDAKMSNLDAVIKLRPVGMSIIELSDSFAAKYLDQALINNKIDSKNKNQTNVFYSDNYSKLHNELLSDETIVRYNDLKKIKNPAAFAEVLFPDEKTRPEPFDQAKIEERRKESEIVSKALLKAYVGQKLSSRAAVNTETNPSREIVTFMDYSGTPEAQKFNREFYANSVSKNPDDVKKAYEMALDKLAEYKISEFDPLDDRLLKSGPENADKLIDFMLKAQDAEILFKNAKACGVNFKEEKYANLLKNAALFQNLGSIWAGKVQLMGDGFYPYVEIENVAGKMTSKQLSNLQQEFADYCATKDDSLVKGPAQRMVNAASFYVNNLASPDSKALMAVGPLDPKTQKTEKIDFEIRVKNSNFIKDMASRKDPHEKELNEFLKKLEGNVRKTLGVKRKNSSLYNNVLDSIKAYLEADIYYKEDRRRELLAACRDYVAVKNAFSERSELIYQLGLFAKKMKPDTMKYREDALKKTADIIYENYKKYPNEVMAKLKNPDNQLENFARILENKQVKSTIKELIMKTDNCKLIAINPDILADGENMQTFINGTFVQMANNFNELENGEVQAKRNVEKYNVAQEQKLEEKIKNEWTVLGGPQ